MVKLTVGGCLGERPDLTLWAFSEAIGCLTGERALGGGVRGAANPKSIIRAVLQTGRSDRFCRMTVLDLAALYFLENWSERGKERSLVLRGICNPAINTEVYKPQPKSCPIALMR